MSSGLFGEGRDQRAEQAAREWQERFGREGHQGSYAQHPADESYRAYRQRHLDELDRDYDEWCREREGAFHRDFDDWRSRRQGAGGTGLSPGATMVSEPGDSSTIAEDHMGDTLVAADEESQAAKPRGRRR